LELLPSCPLRTHSRHPQNTNWPSYQPQPGDSPVCGRRDAALPFRRYGVPGHMSLYYACRSGQNLAHNPCTNRLASLADGETKLFVHGYRLNQRNLDFRVVSRHAHVSIENLGVACHIRGTEVKLWTITIEEG